MNDRFSINGTNALPHAVLWQSYAVEDVAKIAATFQQGTHQERVINALKLIAAVENIANPHAPWLDQDSRRKEGDEPAKQDDLYDLQQQADEIINQATDAEGRINRAKLCKIACDKAGRKLPKTKGETTEKPLSDDRVDKLFRDGWLPQATENHAQRKLFRQMKQDAHREREELRSAIEQSLGKKVINKLREKVAATEAISFQSGREFCPAAEEIARRRDALTEPERKTEREAFRLSLEKGTHNQPRIIHSQDHARAILLGTDEYAGFLEFVRFPESKSKHVPTLPQLRGADGGFVKLERGTDGKKKEIRAVPIADESPVSGLPKEPVERNETNRLVRKSQR